MLLQLKTAHVLNHLHFGKIMHWLCKHLQVVTMQLEIYTLHTHTTLVLGERMHCFLECCKHLQAVPLPMCFQASPTWVRAASKKLLLETSTSVSFRLFHRTRECSSTLS